MDLLDRLLGHDKWTTDELLRRSRELSAGQWDQRFDIGCESVHRTFAHVIDNERIWTELIAGRDPEHVTDGWWDYSLAELTTAYDEAYRDFAELARTIRDYGQWDDEFIDTLDRPPVYKTKGGGVLHVITHSMHHRSEILHMLTRLGLTDLPEGDMLGWEQMQTVQKGAN